MAKPKKVAFELINPNETPRPEPYRLMDQIRAKHHPDIAEARIALAWRKGFKPDPDGRLILGRCIKATDLQRELVDYDFVILLNREVWNEPDFTLAKKRALIDHELCHADRAYNDDGPREDAKGRPVWRIRKHDIEEFQCIVQRHGCYKRDLESFAEVLMRRKNNPMFTSADGGDVPAPRAAEPDEPETVQPSRGVVEAFDRLVAPIRRGGIDTMSITVEGHEPIVIDKEAAENIHRNAQAMR